MLMFGTLSADLTSYLLAQEQLGPAELTRFKDRPCDRFSPLTVLWAFFV